MNQDSGLWFGNRSGSIADLVDAAPELVTDSAFVLITSLDGLKDLQQDPLLRSSGVPHEFLGGGALFESKDFSRLIAGKEMFHGFDELWCFRNRITVVKPEHAVLSGESDIHDGLSGAVVDWMLSTHCVLGLGDGVGLNFVAADQELAQRIEDLFPEVESLSE